MIHFDLPKQKSSIIKVLGVGGGGSNAVNFMFAQDIEGVDFIICNTDAKAIEQSKVPNKIQLGPHLTQGLGAGANPEVGKKATEESLDEIKRILEVNTKMAFICVGMGPIKTATLRDNVKIEISDYFAPIKQCFT